LNGGFRRPYLGTVFVFSSVFWLADANKYPDPIFQLLGAGGPDARAHFLKWRLIW
jgi:hypothetical protein